MVGFSVLTLAVAASCMFLVLVSDCPAFCGCVDATVAVVLSSVVSGMHAVDSNYSFMTTLMVVMSSCTLIIGALAYLLGKYKLLGVVQMFPQCVVHGFLAVVGVKLVEMSIKLGTGASGLNQDALDRWYMMLPVVTLAVALVWTQRHNLLSPVLLWVTFLVLPLVIFYGSMFVFGISMETLEEGGWMLPKMSAADPLLAWKEGYQLDKCHWESVAEAVQQFAPLIPLLIFSTFVGFGATRKAGGFQLSFDEDAELTGKLFSLQALALLPMCVTSTKVNLVNIAICGGTSRVPTIICGGLMCLIFFLGPIILPLCPRWYLAYLLLFNALGGFLVKNVIDSYFHVAKMEYFVIWCMLWVHREYKMDGAVAVGFAAALVVFAYKYSRQGIVEQIAGGPEARRLAMSATRTPSEEMLLRHLSQKLIVLKLRNYLFFGSVLQIQRVADEILLVNANSPGGLAPSWIVIDWLGVVGIDATVPGAVDATLRSLSQRGLNVVFTGLNNRVFKRLNRENVLAQVRHTCGNLDQGVAFVEEALLEQSYSLRSVWFDLDPSTKHNHQLAMLNYKENVLLYMLGLAGHPLARLACRRVVRADYNVCCAGEPSSSFFIVQSGQLGMFGPDGRRKATLSRGAFFNEMPLFLRGRFPVVSSHTVRSESPAVLLEFTTDALLKMESIGELLGELIQLVCRQSSEITMDMSPTYIEQPDIEMQEIENEEYQSVHNVVESTRLFCRALSGHDLAVLNDVSMRKKSETKPCETFVKPSEGAIKEVFERNLEEEKELPQDSVTWALLNLGLDPRALINLDHACDEKEFLENAAACSGLQDKDLSECFSRLSGGDDHITFRTLRKALPHLSEKAVAEVIADASLRNDGAVSFLEFEQAVHFAYVPAEEQSGGFLRQRSIDR
eukprot:TRINITY_DN17568_c0_g1_i1.p1 TRINITY_DN17568_c0_g1~~TRINITY_DN17568_c0_g1_i1.p1  ORF type:complete len:1024 (+),score=226.73 TRINITY_DN17568_c0_g1_i1:373-3072(+)